MDSLIFIILAILYIVTSKALLLERARHDIQLEYQSGSTATRLYILAMLPVYYMSGL